MVLNTDGAVQSLQQRSQDGAFTIKGELLQLEEGKLYREVDDSGYSCSEYS